MGNWKQLSTKKGNIMKTITNIEEINTLYYSAENQAGGFATGRVLSGQYLQENCQEWAELCTINGAPAKIYWIFENSDCESEDAGNYPWTAANVSKIEIAEKDEDGDYDLI
jgi:hypothetical protein